MPAENPIVRLSDDQLRRESKRRRLLTTAISSSASILTMLAAVWVQNHFADSYGFVAVILLFSANIAAVLYLFRWMAVPAKESARRRRKSVLAMLGVSPQSEP